MTHESTIDRLLAVISFRRREQADMNNGLCSWHERDQPRYTYLFHAAVLHLYVICEEHVNMLESPYTAFCFPCLCTVI